MKEYSHLITMFLCKLKLKMVHNTIKGDTHAKHGRGKKHMPIRWLFS